MTCLLDLVAANKCGTMECPEVGCMLQAHERDPKTIVVTVPPEERCISIARLADQVRKNVHTVDRALHSQTRL